MKKIFFAIFMAVSMNMVANAQSVEFNPATITPAGYRSIDSLRTVNRANESRYWKWQSSDGYLSKVYYDGDKFVVGVGNQFGFGQGNIPYIKVGYKRDGMSLWKTYIEDEEGTLWENPVKLFTLSASAFWGKMGYSPLAYSAGQKYMTYGANATLEVRLWEDGVRKGCRHRINALVGVGYIYGRYDELLFDGHYRRINEDGTPYVNADGNYEDMTAPNGGLIIPHYASGVSWKVGLSYSARPFKHYGSRLELEVAYVRNPDAIWNQTNIKGSLDVCVSVAFGGRHVSSR